MSALVLLEAPGARQTRSILVGSDLSSASDRVLQDAARIASVGGAALHVVAAYQPPAPGPGEAGDHVPQPVIEEVRRALPAQLSRILPPGRQPQTAEVRFGRPSRVILDRAKEIHAVVIVLGPHRGRDVHAHFLGTTADEILRGASTPCLALHPRFPLPLRRIGVATDFSEVSDRAAYHALDWAAWLGAGRRGETTEVMIAHALRPGSESAIHDAMARLRVQSSMVVKRHGIPENVRVDCRILSDIDTAGALCHWAESTGIDLLVMGTRSREAVQGNRLGSISSAVARRACCPVLLVPRSA